MPAPAVHRLRAFLPNKAATADAQVLPQFSLTSASSSYQLHGGTDLGAYTANYWNGALGFFTGDTTTVGLRGVFFHVENNGTPGVLILAKNLMAVPAAGDVIRLVLGGNRRSLQEAFGMLVELKHPELTAVTGTNITGLTVKRASPMLGVGTLQFSYDRTANTLQARMGVGVYGPTVSTVGNLTNAIVLAGGSTGWVQVDTVAASLPGSNQLDSFAIGMSKASFTPDFEDYETLAAAGGKIRYRLEVVKNTDPIETMVAPAVFTTKPPGAPTTIAAGSSLALTAGTLNVNDASSWPASGGFWILNTTKNDCRHVLSRSGNALICAAVEWVQVTASNSVAKGSLLRMSAAPSVTATMFENVGGTTFGDKLLHLATVGWTNGTVQYWTGYSWSTAFTISAGTVVYGLRGKSAVSWAASDAVELMSDVDIAVESINQVDPTFQVPIAEFVRPAGLAFVYASTQAASVSLGAELRPGDVVGVWRREWIMAGQLVRSNISAETIYSWS